MTRLLDALHESRRRQALRVISDNSHLLATPEQMASVMKVAHEAKPMPTDTHNKQTSASGSWVSVMMSRSAAITVVVVAVFVLHVIVAAILLDSRTSNAGHVPPIIHTD